jgi:hypothetical protein
MGEENDSSTSKPRLPVFSRQRDTIPKLIDPRDPDALKKGERATKHEQDDRITFQPRIHSNKPGTTVWTFLWLWMLFGIFFWMFFWIFFWVFFWVYFWVFFGMFIGMSFVILDLLVNHGSSGSSGPKGFVDQVRRRLRHMKDSQQKGL